MRTPTRLHAGAAVTGIAVVASAAILAAPVTPPPHPTQIVTEDVRLTAGAVPIGGLITSFLGNQVIYCSLICPLLLETAVTPVVQTLQAPGTFLAALQSGNVLKAIGAAAASVTGPTNAAAEEAILVDSEIPAQRALNAFETGVLGVLNVLTAAPGGPGAILTAIQTARQATFDALNAPIMPNPPSTVMPQGALQVGVISVINVAAAVIFPGFNDFLSAAFETPNAAAQELATTGNPLAAGAAAVGALGARVTAAATVIANSVVQALNNIRAAGPLTLSATQTQLQKATTTTTSAAKLQTTTPATTTNTTSNPLHAIASSLQKTTHSVTKKAPKQPHHTSSNK